MKRKQTVAKAIDLARIPKNREAAYVLRRLRRQRPHYRWYITEKKRVSIVLRGGLKAVNFPWCCLSCNGSTGPVINAMKDMRNFDLREMHWKKNDIEVCYSGRELRNFSTTMIWGADNLPEDRFG